MRQHNRPPLRVLLTVDTEFWPRGSTRKEDLARDYERDIIGRTGSGDFGVEFQLQMLNSYGHKAVFHIESLAARVAGIEPIEETVRLVQSYGHDVQLHIHSEWVQWMDDAPVPKGRSCQNMHDFSLAEQRILLTEAAANLRRAGATNVCAFRAGNYGANNDTLAALPELGIPIDTSYSYAYARLGQCGISTSQMLTEPTFLNGTIEYPVAHFEDWPGHYRHVQLCGCSAREMQTALVAAWHRGWESFVIVSHSFELITDRSGYTQRPEKTTIRRMEDLCRFVQRHNDRFQMSTFSELAGVQPPPDPVHRTLQGSMMNTVGRYFEQAVKRLA